jgi:hypothetical protein
MLSTKGIAPRSRALRPWPPNPRRSGRARRQRRIRIRSQRWRTGGQRRAERSQDDQEGHRTKKTPTAAPQANVSRGPSKTGTILTRLTGPGGASLKTLMNTTGWQAHSARGFVIWNAGQEDGPHRCFCQRRQRRAPHITRFAGGHGPPRSRFINEVARELLPRCVVDYLIRTTVQVDLKI